MEEPVKEQQPLSAGTLSNSHPIWLNLFIHLFMRVTELCASVFSGNSARPKLQRYALRSSSKSKENKQDTAPDLSISSESKRYHFFFFFLPFVVIMLDYIIGIGGTWFVI